MRFEEPRRHAAKVLHCIAVPLPVLEHVQERLDRRAGNGEHEPRDVSEEERLALGELGSRVPALLQAGWPIRYWLPEPSDHLALLHPLARQLGLRRLNRTGAAGQGDVLKQREPY